MYQRLSFCIQFLNMAMIYYIKNLQLDTQYANNHNNMYEASRLQYRVKNRVFCEVN